MVQVRNTSCYRSKLVQNEQFQQSSHIDVSICHSNGQQKTLQRFSAKQFFFVSTISPPSSSPPPLSLTPEMRYPTTYFTPYDKQHQFIRIIVPLNSQLTPTKCVMIPVLDLGSGVIFSALLQFGIRIQIQQKEEPKQ